MPSLEEVLVFSDGSGLQFKNRYIMKYLSVLSSEFNISVSWQFFATDHGQGQRYNRYQQPTGPVRSRILYRPVETIFFRPVF